jgi:hypothetical protein
VEDDKEAGEELRSYRDSVTILREHTERIHKRAARRKVPGGVAGRITNKVLNET